MTTVTGRFNVVVGTAVTLRATFTDAVTGALADPGTVVLTIERPDGIDTDYTPDHDSLGKFSYSVIANQVGVWTISWVGSGTGPNVAKSGSFSVDSLGTDD